MKLHLYVRLLQGEHGICNVGDDCITIENKAKEVEFKVVFYEINCPFQHIRPLHRVPM